MLFYTAITLLCSIFSVIETKCPPLIPVNNCTCSTLTDVSNKEFSTLTCKNLYSEDDIRAAVASTEGYPMFEFELTECSIKYIPHDVFLGTTFEVISIRDSSIHSLSDTDIAFEGLENQLHLLEIINCSYSSDWDWSKLSNLAHIMEIHVNDLDNVDITEGVSSIQHLDVEAFAFQRNHIRSLPDKTFASFSDIERLSLDDNHISELRRTMFPMPARLLKVFGLSYNNLEHLPDDLFVDMPKLRSLYLTGNPLFTVDEKVFRPVWSQLRTVLLYGINLSCDCRLTWLARANNSNKYIHAMCESPARFRGRLLNTMHHDELYC